MPGMVTIHAGFHDPVGTKQSAQQAQRAKYNITTTTFTWSITFSACINTGRSASWASGRIVRKECHNLWF